VAVEPEGLTLFSVDDHVIEPGHVWESRLPAKLRERGPRLISSRDDEYWLFDGERVKPQGVEASAGKDPTEFTNDHVRYDEMRPGFYDPVARLADMDADGVRVQVLFPSGIPRICGKRFLDAPDHELGLACVRAWNDWMLEEWCGAAPERYVHLALLPLWDPVLCAEEVRRCASRGTRGITFSEAPHMLGLPSIHDPVWDPLWEAVTECDIVVCLHIGSSGTGLSAVPGGPVAPSIVMISSYAMYAATELMFSPLFRRWPDLRFVMSEGGIGWLPYTLERAEYTWARHRFWVGDAEAPQPLEVFRRHIGVCFIEDYSGIDNRHVIGVDSIMWEGDYPHTDCSWPSSRERLARQLKDCTDDEVAKITHGNAERFFRFPLAV
jgi:predicted TIM-barrel fold metal-dependent hydrolase